MAEQFDPTKAENKNPAILSTEDSIDISSQVHMQKEKTSDSGEITATAGAPVSNDELDPKSKDGENEPPSEQPLAPAGVDYTVLTPTQKKLVVFTASLASVFSPMATAIYCKFWTKLCRLQKLTIIDPSLETIAKDLRVSNTQINITVTLFLVVQGIAPAFVADLADTTGRRPSMYMFSLFPFLYFILTHRCP